MSESNLPEVITRHHKVTVNSKTLDVITDFCERGLMMHPYHVTNFERVPDMDSYWVYTRSGCRFMVSGAELYDWEQRRSNPVCSPERMTLFD